MNLTLKDGHSSNQAFRQRASKAMYTEGLDGSTYKLEIISQDEFDTSKVVTYNLYLQVAWFEGKLNYLHITLGLGNDYGGTMSGLMSVLCGMAREMLRYEFWSVQDLIDNWKGYRFYPGGACPQLGPGALVRSPVDAVAKFLEMRGFGERLGENAR